MKDRYCIEYISEGSVIIAQPQIRLLLNSFLSNCASLASKRSRICLSRFSTAILRSSSILPRRRNKFVEVRVCIVSARWFELTIWVRQKRWKLSVRMATIKASVSSLWMTSIYSFRLPTTPQRFLSLWGICVWIKKSGRDVYVEPVRCWWCFWDIEKIEFAFVKYRDGSSSWDIVSGDHREISLSRDIADAEWGHRGGSSVYESFCIASSFGNIFWK